MRPGAQELKARFETLPVEVREAIASTNTAEAIEKIADKQNLHIDQLGSLSDQIGLVMMGVTKPQDFIGSVKSALSIDEEQAKQIAVEINAQIFAPIRESLKKIHHLGGDRGGQEEEKPVVSEEKSLKPESDPLNEFLSPKISESAPNPRPYIHDPYREGLE